MQTSYGPLSAWADLCTANPSPVSTALYYLITEGRISEALGYGIEAVRYSDPKQFGSDYMLTNFLKKNEFMEIGIDKAEVCISTWKGTEEACLSTNRRLKSAATSFTKETHHILHMAARKIARVLGDLRVGEVFARSEWSSGSTYDVSRRNAAFDNKMLSKLTVTRSALKYAKAYLETDYHWFAALTGSFPSGPYCVLPNNFTVVDAARATTVPKSYKTDRFISIEPTMNVFLQKGVGKYIRRRLGNVGVDLDDQSVNQKACARAHADNLATVDLSSASDTVAKELIYHLLPFEWACFLDDLRSKKVLIGDDKIVLEKFSSMGNGFTFELESLIFWAISASVCADDADRVCVYGDDIIVPRRYYDLLSSTLTDCGFTVNQTKSFASGSFYESCGKHYFNGVDVTPVFQKKNWLIDGKGFEPEMIRAHNRLVRWHMRVWGQWRSAKTRALLEGLVKNGTRHFIPLGSLGDDGYLRPVRFFGDPDRNHGIYCHVLVRSPKVRQANGEATIALYLRRSHCSPFAGDSGDSVSLADVSIGNGAYRTRHRWVNLQLGAAIG